MRKTALSRKNLSLLKRWASILLYHKKLNLEKSTQLKNSEDIINYYHKHISIEKIKSSSNTQSELLTFNLVSSDEIKQEILILNNKKLQGKEILQSIS